MTHATSVTTLRHSAFARLHRTTFAEAVQQHQDELYGVALRILGERDAALDATSRALLKAFRSWERYDQTRPVRHWLLRIAANEAISMGRQRTRDRERRAARDARLDVADREAPPDVALLAREERQQVRLAVAGLPDIYRVPVVLRYFSELSVNEIAAITGRRASTVGVQLLRARAMLRAALETAR